MEETVIRMAAPTLAGIKTGCGIQLACESVTVNGFPEGADAEVCRELGKALVQSMRM